MNKGTVCDRDYHCILVDDDDEDDDIPLLTTLVKHCDCLSWLQIIHSVGRLIDLLSLFCYHS